MNWNVEGGDRKRKTTKSQSEPIPYRVWQSQMNVGSHGDALPNFLQRRAHHPLQMEREGGGRKGESGEVEQGCKERRG